MKVNYKYNSQLKIHAEILIPKHVYSVKSSCNIIEENYILEYPDLLNPYEGNPLGKDYGYNESMIFKFLMNEFSIKIDRIPKYNKNGILNRIISLFSCNTHSHFDLIIHIPINLYLPPLTDHYINDVSQEYIVKVPNVLCKEFDRRNDLWIPGYLINTDIFTEIDNIFYKKVGLRVRE